MSIHQTLFATYASPMIVVDAADFDGTNDYMTRGAGLTSAADSKSCIISLWAQFDTAVGAPGNVLFCGVTTLAGATVRFRVSRVNDGTLQVLGLTAAGAATLLIATSATFGASATWIHLLASFDLSTTTAHLYINDASDLVTTTNNDNAIDYTLADWAVGAFADGTTKADGGLAEIYVALGQYLDFSLVSNRRKFISASGKPVYLGADGSVPTGTAPIVYQRVADGAAVATFATNLGTGGDLTITGTLTTDSTSPSD